MTMDLEDKLEYLAGILPRSKKRNEEVNFCCPVHNDENPSAWLKIGDQNKDAIIFKCFGCNAGIKDLGHVLGLPMNFFFRDSAKDFRPGIDWLERYTKTPRDTLRKLGWSDSPRGLKFSRGTMTKYRGGLKGKYFHDDGSKLCVFSNGVKSRSGIFFGCEGLTDWTVASSLGLPAICFPGTGTMSKKYLSSMKDFNLVKVLIHISDNDPGGKQASVNLSKESPCPFFYFDLGEFQDLRLLDASSTSKEETRLKLFSLLKERVTPSGLLPSEIWKRTSPRVEIVVPGLLVSGCTYLYGLPYCGKSTLVRNLACAVVNRTKFLGSTPADGGILMVFSERSADWSLSDSRIFIGEFTEGDFVEWLSRSIEAIKPILVVIDTVTSFKPRWDGSVYEGDYRFFSRLDRLGVAKKCAILCVGHGSKGAGPSITQSINGSMGIPAACTTVIRMHFSSQQRTLEVVSNNPLVERRRLDVEQI